MKMSEMKNTFNFNTGLHIEYNQGNFDKERFLKTCVFFWKASWLVSWSSSPAKWPKAKGVLLTVQSMFDFFFKRNREV